MIGQLCRPSVSYRVVGQAEPRTLLLDIARYPTECRAPQSLLVQEDSSSSPLTCSACVQVMQCGSQPVPALVLAVPLLIRSHEYRRQFHKKSKLAISATGMAMRPILKNSQAVITTFSRRRAMSQRIVASEPVTERLGPRSTPISIACATTLVSCACRIAAPLIRPTGKLLIPFETNAATRAAVPLATQVVVSASPRRPVSPKRSRPAFCNASTMTKSPATNGRTDQDTPFATFSGTLRSRHATTAMAKMPAQQVGAPSESPRAEDETSVAAAMANPTRASFPSVESNTRFTSPRDR